MSDEEWADFQRWDREVAEHYGVTVRPPVSGEPPMCDGVVTVNGCPKCGAFLHPSRPPVSGETSHEARDRLDEILRDGETVPTMEGWMRLTAAVNDALAEARRQGKDEQWDEVRPMLAEARATPPSLDAIRAAIEAEPFFPNGDGPSIGNATAFRDYRRRILARLTSKREPHDHDCVAPTACGVTGFYCYNSRPPVSGEPTDG